ncbi:MAG: hypothetical protein SO160_04935 [Lachnospiraceae bacterium]|nr:hypothetical protein [Lachnospiraceae bacterium]
MKANRVVRIILVLLCVICLLLLLSYVNHKMKLKKEDALFVTNGTMVNVNGHNLNVYVSYKMSRLNVQKILYKNVQLVCLL